MQSRRGAPHQTIGGGRETSSEPDRMFIAEMLRRRQSGLIRQLSITAQRRGQPRGDQVHSVLLLDALSEQTVGLIEQSHWCREVESYGKKHQRKKRAYQDKES